MARTRYVHLDYETEGIEGRPSFPPRPVGAALSVGDTKPKYYAWGHPGGNNCTQADFKRILKSELERPDTSLIAHNDKFEHEVTEQQMGVRMPPPERCHDTMILGFLDDPYAYTLELKPMATRYLGEAATERDELKDWIVTNVPEAKQKKSEWGRYICRAPADLVGRYAIGDVTRTRDLFKLLHKKVVSERGMGEPYLREMRLIPVLIENEREGLTVDMPLLTADVQRYNKALEQVDDWIRKRVRSPGLVVDEREQLADAIDKCGKAKNGWLLTPTGKRSTKRESLEHALSDKLLMGALAYRGSLATCLRTFMQPWLNTALRHNGRIYTSWHSTRGADDYGARTGRLSSTPNLQNIPTEFEDEAKIFKATGFDKVMAQLKLPALPMVRSYIISEKGRVLCGRDYNSQELRVLAHYEDGTLSEQYNADPKLDVHQFVANMILGDYPDVNLGANPRRTCKTLNFLKVYGGGKAKLAMKLGIDMDTAGEIMTAYMNVFPGLADLNKDMKRRERDNEPIKTLGGRLYYAEPPRVIKGRLQTFGYKLLNYLVQGSSADMTKEAVLRYNAVRKESRLLLTVHDEVVITSPQKAAKREMALLREAMESVKLDVPVISEGEMGTRWTEMQACE